jgi:general secretion pathway protein H
MRQRGFTLLEIVVAVAIVAMVLGYVALNASGSLKRAALSHAGHDLVSALRYTRGQAIVSGAEQRLEIDVEKQTYHAPRRPEIALPRGLKLSLLTAASEQTSRTSGAIRFFPDGSSTGGRLKLIAGEREWEVEVAWLTGEVRLRESQP